MEVRKAPEWKDDSLDIETGTRDIALSIAEIYGLPDNLYGERAPEEKDLHERMPDIYQKG